MSKSIFIIDTPACCGECPMSATDVCRKWSRKDAKTFPKDCPLKPAYDVDKVVERLEQKRDTVTRSIALNSQDDDVDSEILREISHYQEIIKIVKSGGIE